MPQQLVDLLFSPARYKVAHGGRGSGKSWAFARAILVMAANERLRVLCTREVQRSIKESVKRLLDDQIEAMGLGWFYQSLETEIRGRNGSEIIFAGLATHTVDSIKSYEGVDICWIEEAQTVSKRSLDILTPTIRKPDSEIWITFNPLLDTDEVWQRFVVNTPPNARVVQINWSDNPWFPEVLEQERAHCQATSPDDYQNIWEGQCRSAVEGAIYASEVAQAQVEGRVAVVPYNPKLRVHVVWDLGWNDAMSLVLVQKSGPSQLSVIEYIEGRQQTLEWYVSELRKRNYNWGYDWLPHDASHKDFKTGQNTHQILRRLGRKTREVPQIGVEPGIRLTRMTLPRCWFDKAKTERLLECLKRYRRAIPTTTGEPGSPVHDEYSHGADAMRYMSVIAERLSNEIDSEVDREAVAFVAYADEMGY